MNESVKHLEISIEKQLEFYQLISRISHHFFSLETQDDQKAIDDALGLIGSYINVDRCYIFKYDFIQSTTSNTYEWCKEGIDPFIHELQNIPLDLVQPWVEANLRGEGIYISKVDELSNEDPLYVILSSQGIKSLLVIPLFDEHGCYGFLGLDSVESYREYTVFEQKALEDFSNLLLGVIKRIELRNTIKETSDLIKSVLYTQEEIIFRMNTEGIITFVNHAFCELNYSDEQHLVGISIFEVSPPSIHDKLHDIIKNPSVLNKEKRFLFEGEDAKQKHIIIEWESYPIYRQKQLSEFQLIGRDLTYTKMIEQSLSEERSRLKEVVKASHIGTFEWDLEQNKIIINDIYAEMIGYTKAELEPYQYEDFLNIVHPDDLGMLEQRVQEIIENHEDYFQMDFRLRNKNGRYQWVKGSGNFSEWDAQGQVKKMYGTHINISANKEAEFRLQVYEKAFQASPASIIITDVEANIEYANPAFTTITGYRVEEIIGQNMRIFKSNLHPKSFYKEMWDTILSGKTWEGEFYNVNKQRKGYWESASIAPAYDTEGNISKFVAIKIDITDRKNYQQQLTNQNQMLEKEIYIKQSEINDAQRAATHALARLTESRDYTTGKHVDRVQYLCRALAEALLTHDHYKSYITEGYVEDIFYASLLHDIGKIGIPDHILLKPGKLTPEEFDIMKTHVDIGAKTLTDMVQMYPNNRIIEMGIHIAKYHHEKWNGQGYMEGLSGEDIPLSARIMAIVDAYDAIRSKRPYKDEIPHQKAVEIITKDAGTHFDPVLVEVFNDIEKRFEDIYNTLND